MAKYPVIILQTSEPVDGFWDGGKKDYFEFTPRFTSLSLGQFNDDGTFTPSTDTPHTFKPLGTIKWGCWDANFWFNCGAGVSWANAINYAKMRLNSLYRGHTAYTLTVEWQEELSR